MANKGQLRILQQGIDTWNEYRKSHRHININLRGANLSKQNLSGADFSYADIRGTKFIDANLRGAKFTLARCGLQTCQMILMYTFCILLFLVMSAVVTLIIQVVAQIKVIEGVMIVLSMAGVGLFCFFLLFFIAQAFVMLI
ncbi:MAG: pentapeptide repeat-containing protein [Xenococcus sp. MO_188.B8]|nr:pentapeptide repeat-containing protein [Xenococcus sp. MO_188.B8]